MKQIRACPGRVSLHLLSHECLLHEQFLTASLNLIRILVGESAFLQLRRQAPSLPPVCALHSL